MSAPAGDRPTALLEGVRRALAELELAGQSLLVACSGGPDSTALLIALAELREEFALALCAATIDHGLRQGSARDALYVERLCRALGLPCERRQIDLGAAFPDGLEAAARAARYAALDEMAAARRADAIATGHTLEDQAETVLMRLACGAGLAGARGIQRRRGKIVRPLLDVARTEVCAFLAARRVRARIDPTNASLAFTRNRVRHQLLPALEQALGPASLTSIARFARIAARDESCLGALAERAASEICAPLAHGPGLGGEVRRLAELDPALRFRVLRRAVEALGTALDFDACERLERALACPRPTRVSLPHGIELRVRYGQFELGPLRRGRATAPSAPDGPLLICGPMEGRFQAWRVAARWLAPAASPRTDAVAIDAEEAIGLRWPLQVRARAPGDVFAPAGTGHKKLKAWLIDAKIPREVRDDLVLLADAAGEVLWIVGHRKSRWTRAAVGARGGLEVSIQRAAP